MSLENAPERGNEKVFKKARFSRDFLAKNNIAFSQFSEMVKDTTSLELSEQEYSDDEKLVENVKQIQALLGFPELENSKGQDGMLGPYTLSFLESKNKRADLKDEVKQTQELGSETENNMQKVLEQQGGVHEIVKLSGNGNRAVSIFVPPGFDPNKPVEIVYHFHGTHSHVVGVPLPSLEGASNYYKKRAGKISVGEDRFTQAITTINQQVSKGERNTIIVYPLSAGRRGSVGSVGYKNGYDENWMKKESGESMETLHTETMEELAKLGYGNLNKPSITVTGHSAGGMAITNIIKSGFNPDKVKYLDASYGHWLQSAMNSAKSRNSKTDFEVYYRPNTTTDQGLTEGANFIKSSKVHDVFISEFV